MGRGALAPPKGPAPPGGIYPGWPIWTLYSGLGFIGGGGGFLGSPAKVLPCCGGIIGHSLGGLRELSLLGEDSLFSLQKRIAVNKHANYSI